MKFQNVGKQKHRAEDNIAIRLSALPPQRKDVDPLRRECLLFNHPSLLLLDLCPGLSYAFIGERGEALQRELELTGCPGEAQFVAADVLSETDIKNLVAMTLNLYGRIDCFVNNAGILPRLKEIDDVTAASFRYVLDLNVVGCFLGAKYSLPHLRKTKGSIINISSIAAVTGSKNSVAYVSSKGAVTAMTKAMALDESKYGVRVNCISPGNIWTPAWQKFASEAADPKARVQGGVDAQPMGRFGTPEEIAKAAFYLATDATFSIGDDLWVTGGIELGFGQKNQQDDTKGVNQDHDSPVLERAGEKTANT